MPIVARRATARTYATVILALAAAVLVRYLLDPWMGDSLPLVTLFGAVAAAVWIGGVWPAIIVVALGYLAADYLFLPPRGAFGLGGAPGIIGLLAYLFTCALVVAIGEAARRADRDRTAQLFTARQLASIIESSEDAIVGKSLDGVIRSWNAAAEAMFGYPADQAIGHHISLVIPPERLQEEEHIIANVRAGRRIEHFETERMRADGRRIWVSLTISPMKDETGHIVGASKIARDVTRQREAEADRAKFVTLIENSTDFIGLCDMAGVPFFVNRAGLAMVGLHDLEEARRVPVASFFFPEDQRRIMDEFFPSVLERGHGEIEVRFRHFKTGEARWMAYKVLTLPDVSGQPIAFATVSQDVTERKRMEDDLRSLAAHLSDADRRKNEFLAMLAHELRNPLAPISNAVRTLKLGGGTDPDAVRSTSAMLERQVAQMSRLVDDLLDMSRITRGRIELRRERVDLAPIVRQAVEGVRAQYASLRHELTVTIPPHPLPLDADPARLTQVIANLLNNAAKFTDRGGRISLTVEEDEGAAVIRVRDSGIGIAAGQLRRVFDMFAQVDTSLERSRDGLGIGLTLVKTLVELHGGTVSAHSGGLGHGSEFTVRLPLSTAPREAAAPAPVAGPPAAARRVLIVDDSEDGAESLSILLEMAGHQTWKAHDGIAAVETAGRVRPDVILLDIGLPRLNGYEACRRIRQEPWGEKIVIVALTGWGQEDDRAQSRDAGFDAHMVKPVDHDALLAFLAASTSRPRS